MSAIGIALDVNSEVFIVLNAADVLFGGGFLLFVLSIRKPLIGRVLKAPGDTRYDSDFVLDQAPHVRGSSMGLGLAVVVLAIGLGMSMLLFGRLHEMTILLVITWPWYRGFRRPPHPQSQRNLRDGQLSPFSVLCCGRNAR